MHTERSKNNFIIETSVEYNPDDFAYMYAKYDSEFEMYHSKHGTPLGLEVVYNPDILQEPIVDHWVKYFTKHGLEFNFDMNDDMEGSGQAGFQLIRTNLSDGQDLSIHQDGYRNAGLVIPLSFPQRIQWYDKDDNELYNHEYTQITCINAGGARHGVKYSAEKRWQFQFDVFNTWEELQDLILKIA